MTAREAEQLREDAVELGVTLDDPSIARIGKYIALLELWNRSFHLTGDRDRRVLVRKHVVDSLAVVPELPKSGLVADLGSGAGFPGIVLGCVRPDLDLVLVEPRRRATSFLSEVVRSVPLPAARVMATRAEQVAGDPALAGQVSTVVSRALRLDVILDLGAPLLAPDGSLVAMQTPSVSRVASGALAERVGLRLSGFRDYRLPDGERRRLIMFARS